MNAKRYLEKIKEYDTLINNKLAELSQLRALVCNVTSALKPDVVQSSKQHDNIANTIVKIVDLEKEISVKVDRFIDYRQKCIKILEQVPNTLQYTVLHKHYVQYKDFDVIAAEENYTYSWIVENHLKGLKSVQIILNNLSKPIENDILY